MSASTELRVKELLRERGWTTKVLSEKTGISESYLTHIKNGTRRWNEDALRKLADAFTLNAVDIFSQRKSSSSKESSNGNVEIKTDSTNTLLKATPVMSEIPDNPSPFNNQLMQTTTGHKNEFVATIHSKDESLFCFLVDDSMMAPKFIKGDFLLISPAAWTKSGDIAAVEYGNNSKIKKIMTVTYMDDFIVLEHLGGKKNPIALVRGKDHFRVIGKIMQLIQKLG